MALIDDGRGSITDPLYVIDTVSDPNVEPLNEYLRDPNNANASTNLNMDVNGSSTDQVFNYSADPTKDCIISTVMMIMTDSTVDTDLFGAVVVGGPTFRLSLFKDIGSGNFSESPIILTVEKLEELVEQCERFEPFDDRFDMDVPAVGIKLFFSVDGGKLDAGTNDYIGAVITDDIRGLNKFRIFLKGAKVTAAT